MQVRVDIGVAPPVWSGEEKRGQSPRQVNKVTDRVLHSMCIGAYHVPQHHITEGRHGGATSLTPKVDSIHTQAVCWLAVVHRHVCCPPHSPAARQSARGVPAFSRCLPHLK